MMQIQAVEFQSVVKDGAIQIPDEYRQEFEEDNKVKVIVLMPKKQRKDWKIMDELAKNPISVKGLPKLTRDEIHDRRI